LRAALETRAEGGNEYVRTGRQKSYGREGKLTRTQAVNPIGARGWKTNGVLDWTKEKSGGEKENEGCSARKPSSQAHKGGNSFRQLGKVQRFFIDPLQTASKKSILSKQFSSERRMGGGTTWYHGMNSRKTHNSRGVRITGKIGLGEKALEKERELFIWGFRRSIV